MMSDKLIGVTLFSTPNANCGYCMIELDQESLDLCIFNSEFGRFKFNRLAFGLNVAHEIFRKKMSDTFPDIPGVEVIMDDILICAKTKSEHDETLKRVLERCKERKIKLNKSKCKFSRSEVSRTCEIAKRQIRDSTIFRYGHIFDKIAM